MTVYQLLEHIRQNCFWVSFILDFIRDSQQGSAFVDKVGEIFVCAFICHLCKSHPKEELLSNKLLLYFSDANSESRSKSSSGGGGNSRKIGGKTAGSSPSKGVSNWGGISVSCLCSTFNYL